MNDTPLLIFCLIVVTIIGASILQYITEDK